MRVFEELTSPVLFFRCMFALWCVAPAALGVSGFGCSTFTDMSPLRYPSLAMAQGYFSAWGFTSLCAGSTP